MKRARCFVSAGVFLSVSACASAHVTQREGFIPVEGGRVWYQVVGSGPNTPLLVIHGGSGGNYFYLQPMAALVRDHPLVFFHQLCGAIIHPHHEINTSGNGQRIDEENDAARRGG